MADSTNKVKFGLSNVYVAKATIAADHTAVFDTPFAIPGAVALTMDPQGGETRFRADNVNYWIGQSNSGYSGNLEIALLPKKFKTDILGFSDKDGVLFEDVNAPTVPFALLFQFEGDVNATRHVIYNCAAGRPAASGNTTEETITPQTESFALSSGSILIPALGKEIAVAHVDEVEEPTVYAGWNSAVYLPTGA